MAPVEAPGDAAEVSGPAEAFATKWLQNIAQGFSPGLRTTGPP
jgi:hypothetical protein